MCMRTDASVNRHACARTRVHADMHAYGRGHAFSSPAAALQQSEGEGSRRSRASCCWHLPDFRHPPVQPRCVQSVPPPPQRECCNTAAERFVSASVLTVSRTQSARPR
eukprot:6186159-Pleurochrysis_carterae.AAC.6